MDLGKAPYIVVGAAGMLGTDLIGLLWDSGATVVGLDLPEIDIGSDDSTRTVLSSFEPGVIINLAAITDVDGCETQFDKAFTVNARGPENLARIAAQMGHLLVHLSTDYVFDGTKDSPYKEDDPMNPLGVYGKSKAEGEKRIKELLEDDHCIIRTAWLYGLHGKNFVEKILTAASERNVLQVVDDQVGHPTYTMDLAKAIVELCKRRARGTFHVTNSGEVTWYGFALRILEKQQIRNVTIQAITTEQLGRPAPRPRHSMLDNSKFIKLIGSPLRSWEEALDEYLSSRTKQIC